jgi:hypothetical protein
LVCFCFVLFFAESTGPCHYQCINMYKGGHLFYPRSLQVVFVF